MGKQTELTSDIRQKIVAAIGAGNFYEVACSLAGIQTETFYQWLAFGEEGQSEIYQSFAEEVKRAEAIAEAKRLQVIVEASVSNWQAAKWLLEKRFPHKWGKSKKQEDAKKEEVEREVSLPTDFYEKNGLKQPKRS